MADRSLLRLSAILLLVGWVLSYVAQLPHPGGGDTMEATFASYASDTVEEWFSIHLAQLLSEAVLLAGLLVLFSALDLSERGARLVGLVGIVATAIALGLYTVLSGVDGVALKQAVDAWASAPAAEKAVRFASAETVRWLEWAVNSYWSFAQGLALVLLATVVVWTARIPRPIGYLMGLSGIAFVVLGWQVGTEGFISARAVPTDVGYLSFLASAVWLFVVAVRMSYREPRTVGVEERRAA